MRYLYSMRGVGCIEKQPLHIEVSQITGAGSGMLLKHWSGPSSNADARIHATKPTSDK